MRVFGVVALLAWAGPGWACAVAEPFFVTDVALGPLVARAEVTDYRMDEHGGHLSLRVVEPLQGKLPGRLTAVWATAMAEPPPDRWLRPTAVIVALAPGDGDYALVVQVCGQAHLVEDTEANRAEVRAALVR